MAKPRAKTARVEMVDPTHFTIFVKEPPTDGKANKAIAKALAKHLGIAPSRLTLVSGLASKAKVFVLS